jgi:D-amino-acid dehydrogenase
MAAEKREGESDNAKHKDPVAVIGAGIVGVSTAIWLLREGRRVVLIDRKGPGEGTSFGNGGVLASCSVVPVAVPGLIAKAPGMLLDPNQPLFLKWPYLPKLAPWLVRYLSHANKADVRRISEALIGIVGESLAEHQALAGGTKAEKWIKPCDYLYVYRDRQHFESDRFGWNLRASHGFQWNELEGESFRAYDPLYSKDFGFAVCLENHGRIGDPGMYVKDLAAHAVARGARILNADVTGFILRDGRVTGLRAGGETIACTDVVICAGAWSKPLAAKLGLNVPLESERGYHLELWEPNVMPRSPAMVASGKFVITPMEGRLRLAGIVEFGGLDAEASRKPFELLLRNMKAAIPGIDWKETSEWMGHRPAPADSIPVIGPVPKAKGAWLGFGHHHIGLTGGPRTGRLLAQLISGKSPNIDLAPYAPSRFE